MAIQLIVKTEDYRQKVSGTIDTYATVTGRTIRWGDVGNHLLDGMLQANTNVGSSVSWIDLTHTIAKGTAYGQEHGGQDRVLVIDGDNADANDVIDAMLWLSNQHD